MDAGDSPTTVDLETDRLYAGHPESLRALHSAVAEMTHALGEDVRPVVSDEAVRYVRGASGADAAPAGAPPSADAERSHFLSLGPSADGHLLVGLVGPTDELDKDPQVSRQEFAGSARVAVVDPDELDWEIIALEPLLEVCYAAAGTNVGSTTVRDPE